MRPSPDAALPADRAPEPAAESARTCRLVLVGGGHAHVEVLRAFGRRPLPGLEITLLCADARTPYSGMLPGYVAGHYGFDEIHLDLARLAAFAGARLVVDAASGLDPARRLVFRRDGPPLPYDLVSLNVGATPRLPAGAAGHGVAVKPVGGFAARWQALLDALTTGPSAPRRIAVVGAGAGGVELLLAMQWRLARELSARGRDPGEIDFALYSASPTILPTHGAAVRRRFDALLAARRVRVRCGAPVVAAGPGWIASATGERWAADAVFWVTAAGGPAWLADSGLALDDSGCVRVGPGLQSVSDRRVFAAGDVAGFDDRRLEKAGVFAVRMGPPLAANLRRAALGEAPLAWTPQRGHLALIGTGDRHAIASRGRFCVGGRWVWRWKEWIDRRFVRHYAALPGPPGSR